MSFLENNKSSIPQDLIKDMDAYIKAVNIIPDGNFDKKYYSKLLKHSQNTKLIDYIVGELKGLECPLFETSQFFFCTLATIGLSGQENAMGYIDELSDIAIKEKNSMIAKLRYIAHTAIQNDTKNISQKIENYYAELYKNSDFFRFADIAGLDVSALSAGDDIEPFGKVERFSVSLSTVEGVTRKFELQQGQEKDFYVLTVRAYLPFGSERCFSLELTAPSQTVKLYHWHKDVPLSNETKVEIYDERTKEKSIIEGGACLLNLKETIEKIEKLLGIKFYKTFAGSSFSRGVKEKKKFQEWLLK